MEQVNVRYRKRFIPDQHANPNHEPGTGTLVEITSINGDEYLMKTVEWSYFDLTFYKNLKNSVLIYGQIVKKLEDSEGLQRAIIKPMSKELQTKVRESDEWLTRDSWDLQFYDGSFDVIF